MSHKITSIKNYVNKYTRTNDFIYTPQCKTHLSHTNESSSHSAPS